jgi:polygalacturonase
MFLAENCKNILLQGVTFQNSPEWCIHPLLCENVMLIRVIIRNPWYSQNGDGLDIESCKHSLVYNCIFDVGDDAICVKSGKDKEGRDRGVPTEKLIVAKNTVYHGHGGFTIGSEMSGGVKDVYVTDCKFLGTDIGLRFKSAYERGGVVDNIHIKNIYMTNIPTDAIRFTMAYQGNAPTEAVMSAINSQVTSNQELDEKIPTFQNFNISNITVHGARNALNIIGIPGPFMKDISIKNMIASTTKGVECSSAQNILLENIQFIVSEGPTISLSNTQGFSVKNSTSNFVDEAFIEVLDSHTSEIISTENKLPEGMEDVKEFRTEVQ